MSLTDYHDIDVSLHPWYDKVVPGLSHAISGRFHSYAHLNNAIGSTTAVGGSIDATLVGPTSPLNDMSLH